MQRKAIGGGSFSGQKMPDATRLARVSNKFIYHSGTIDQLDNMKWGLEPQHGDWIKEIAEHSGDVSPDEILDRSVPLVWMSDEPSWVKMKVARKLGKHPQQVTENDIRDHGHLALIPKKGDHSGHIWKVGDDGLSNGEYSKVTNLNGETKKAGETGLYDYDSFSGNREPFGVERNEYVSAEPVEPMFHLTGQDLVDFLKEKGQIEKADGGSVDDQDQGIDVYHSSPHEFDRFSLSQIGTGEGNQMYGHGLYFAESPAVSGQGGDYWKQFWNKMPAGPEHSAASALFSNKFDRDKAIADLMRAHEYSAARSVPGKYGEGPDVEEGHRLLADQYKAAADMLREGKTAGPRTYEVRIDAHPDHFFDWDKPIEEQHPKVLDAIAPFFPAGVPTKNKYGAPLMGGDLYHEIKERAGGVMHSPILDKAGVPSRLPGGTAERLSRYLSLQGVPGIRYLDQGSRNRGGGTRNYVVFDDKLVTTKRRYADGGPVDDQDQGITAYHGSPHEFDQFDISKIGTGEGAQAYGHGLYFAENEGVARGYRDALAHEFVYLDGERIPHPSENNPDSETIYRLANHMYQMGYSTDQAIEDAVRRAEKLSPNLSHSDFYKIREAEKAKKWAEDVLKYKGKKIEWKDDPGHMYEVRINAHPDHFLDWDKPLSEQSEYVQNALREHTPLQRARPYSPNTKGEDIYYRNTQGIGGKDIASQELHRLGIKGIKYLDQGSRGAGEGSRNYVVFDDKLVTTKRRYAEGGEVERIPHTDPQYAKNLKKFHGKTPDVIKNGKWLHGTDRDFQSFMRGPSGAIFVTQDPEFANRYAHGDWTPEQLQDAIESTRHFKTSEPMLNVMPVHVRAEKPFDYENKKHIAALYEELGPDLIMDPYLHKFMDEVREGHWGAIESSPIQNAIKAMGHDSFFVKENGVKNLGVYDPSQIKSATGNNGQFDRTNLDITKSEGGALDDLPVDRIKMSHKDVTQRVPQLTEAAQKLGTDEMTHEMYQGLVNKHKPVRPWNHVPEPATHDEIANAVRENQRPAVGKGHLIPEGHPVGLRLDIPAYTQHGVWAPTIHDKSGPKATVLAHEPAAHITNAEFSLPESKAIKVAQGTAKSPFATIDGNWKATHPDDIRALAKKYLNHPEWSQVGMDPERHSYFYNRDTQEPITHADEVLQVGPLVLAKNARTVRPKTDFKYKSGGEVESYPLRSHHDWEEAHNYEKTGGKLGYESPKKYLHEVKPLNMDHDDKKLIHHFKKQMKKGEKLDPVAIYPDGHPNGRHRAHAAEDLGIKKIPVVKWPEKKKGGGPVVDKALMVISRRRAPPGTPG